MNDGLVSSSQSGFKSKDSCLNRLSFITHERYHLLDNGLEVRSIFLGISKALNLLIRFGMMVLFLNTDKLELQAEFLIRDASRDLVPFIQFKKLEKQPWRSVTF